MAVESCMILILLLEKVLCGNSSTTADSVQPDGVNGQAGGPSRFTHSCPTVL